MTWSQRVFSGTATSPRALVVVTGPLLLFALGFLWIEFGRLPSDVLFDAELLLPFVIVVASALLAEALPSPVPTARLTAIALAALIAGGLLVFGAWYACAPVALPVRVVVALLAGSVGGLGYWIGMSTASAALRPRAIGERLSLFGATFVATAMTTLALLLIGVGFVAPALACRPG
jgi:hypothetical protein